MARVWIGTSGWVYPHWRGVFYPETLAPSGWFAHYARHFETVEINNTFYHLPQPSTFAGWKRQAPQGFRYAVKANRFLTHVKRLLVPPESLERFYSRVEALGQTLGPILYQLPPRWRCNPERLKGFLESLPQGYTHVFEFRDASWMNEEVFRLLEEHHVGFCIMSLPGFDCPVRATAAIAYLRFHGSGELYGGSYPAAELAEWAEVIRGFLIQGREVYAYFNNDAFGYAIENAQELRTMLSYA